MTHTRLAAAIGIAAITAAGLGASAALTGCGAVSSAPAASSTPAAAATPGYSYYTSMMERLSSGMMGGTSSRGWMTGNTSYALMMGGAGAPAWMQGHALPGYMMGTSHDPGKVMGALFANAPGLRVSAAQATSLGSQVPAGATASIAQHRITFSGTTVRLAVVGSPAGGPDETFRIAGMVNPTIVVPASARVSMEVINADPGTSHGLVITASGTGSSWMPMTTASATFPDAAVWFLGNPTTAGMHAATLTFTASTPGTYRYLCPVPGHAQKGMIGTFIVSST